MFPYNSMTSYARGKEKVRLYVGSTSVGRSKKCWEFGIAIKKLHQVTPKLPIKLLPSLNTHLIFWWIIFWKRNILTNEKYLRLNIHTPEHIKQTEQQHTDRQTDTHTHTTERRDWLATILHLNRISKVSGSNTEPDTSNSGWRFCCCTRNIPDDERTNSSNQTMAVSVNIL